MNVRRQKAESAPPGWPWAGSTVILRMKDGKSVKGYFGTNSALGGDVRHPDIYLERVLEGLAPSIDGAELKSDGLWVSGNEIDSIEIQLQHRS